MSNATLFVRFRSTSVAEDKGFKHEHSYPVYQVRDVEEEDDLATEFLLANNDGDLSWIPMGEFKRSKPAPSGGRDNRRPYRSDRGRDQGRDQERDQERGRDRDNRGNRRADGPNPHSGSQDSILGGRDFDN